MTSDSGQASNEISCESISFEDLVSSPARLRQLLAGSWILSDDDDAASLLSVWEESRRFIVDVIARAGRVLDFGCANGFLLRCVVEWSDHQLEAYGVDIDESLVESAWDLFPGHPERFVVAAEDSDPRALFEVRFDYVYWAVGDNVDFGEAENLRWFWAIWSLVAQGGLLILGFYGGPEVNIQKLCALAAAGVPVDSVRENASSTAVMLATVSGCEEEL